MKITVFGASGGVGMQFVQQAIQANHLVRAIYRAKVGISPRVGLEEAVLAHFYDVDSLAELVRGSDVVVSCLGQRRSVPRNPWSRLLTPTDFMERFSSSLIQAMSKPGMPKRLLAISAAGVGSSEPAMHPLLRFVFEHSNIGVAYKDLAKMEAQLENSALDWVAVRPVTLTPGRLTGNSRVSERYGLMHTISRANVADYLLKCVENPNFAPGRHPLIRG